jgi:hypothetical protein
MDISSDGSERQSQSVIVLKKEEKKKKKQQQFISISNTPSWTVQ